MLHCDGLALECAIDCPKVHNPIVKVGNRSRGGRVQRGLRLDWARNSLGDMPKRFWKTRLKWAASLKPQA